MWTMTMKFLARGAGSGQASCRGISAKGRATLQRFEQRDEMVDRQTASSSFLTSRLTQSTANNRLTMLLDHITSVSYSCVSVRSKRHPAPLC